MVMPPHHVHRAPHHTPQPLLVKPHPAAAHHHKAPSHAHETATHHKTRAGAAMRATVIAVGNPTTVQIHGSDAVVNWTLAANITTAELAVGAAVVGVVFNPADPSDGLLTGVY
jgi:hypothetical protein